MVKDSRVEFYLSCGSPRCKSRSNATWELCGGRGWFSESKNKVTRQSWPCTEEVLGERWVLCVSIHRKSLHWPLKGQVMVCTTSEPEGMRVFRQLENPVQREVCTLVCLLLYFQFTFIWTKLWYPLPLNLNYYIFKICWPTYFEI